MDDCSELVVMAEIRAGQNTDVDSAAPSACNTASACKVTCSSFQVERVPMDPTAKLSQTSFQIHVSPAEQVSLNTFGSRIRDLRGCSPLKGTAMGPQIGNPRFLVGI